MITASDAFAAAMAHMRAPFDWRACDCCTAACAAFRALHGVDPLDRFTGRYRDAAGAYRIIRRAGGYLAWCKATLALCGVAYEQPGDLVLVESVDRFGAALGLCIQPGETATKTLSGLKITNARVLGAWSCLS